MAARVRVIRDRSSTLPARYESLSRSRLLAYIRINVVVILIATVWLIAVRSWLAADWIDVLVLLLAALVGCMLLAGGMVSAGRAAAAVVLVAAANWSVLILDTAIVPYALFILPPFVLLPTLLAVPHLNRENLAALLGGAVAATVTLAAAGRLSPGVGLETLIPDSVLDELTVIFIPVCAGLACVLAWQSHQALAARADALQDTGARLAAATDLERRRIERDLHDGAQQRLVLVAMRLRVAQRLQRIDPDSASDLLGTLAQDVQNASAELRDLSHGIYPPQLDDQGLAAALHAAVLSIPIPVSLHCEQLARYPQQIESAVYFSCLEGLRNAAEHAGPGAQVTLTLHDEPDGLIFDLRDTGTGYDADTAHTGHGLLNINDRIGALGGTLTIHTHPGAGVHLHGNIPATAAREQLPRRTAATARVRTALTAVWSAASKQFGRITIGHTEDERITAGFLVPLRAMAWSVPFILGVYLVLRDGWVLALAALSLGATLGLLFAVRAVRAGRTNQALIICAVTVWTFTITATAMVPVLLAPLSLIMVLPVILAVPHTRGRFLPIMAVTVVLSCGVAWLGCYSPGVGIQEQTPAWLIDVGIIFFIASTMISCLLIDQLNHAGLTMKSAALRASQARLVGETDLERRRIERDLHDGAQQRLVVVAMQLRVAQRLQHTDPDSAADLLGMLAQDVQNASAELRDLSHGIYPPQLSDQGLAAALQAAVLHLPLPVTLRHPQLARYPQQIESAVYFSCLEGLQNTAKHAGPGAQVTLSLHDDPDGLTFDLRDTGTGCDPDTAHSGHGLRNINDRIGALGGTLTIHAQPGAGVHLHGHVPASST